MLLEIASPQNLCPSIMFFHAALVCSLALVASAMGALGDNAVMYEDKGNLYLEVRGPPGTMKQCLDRKLVRPV